MKLHLKNSQILYLDIQVKPKKKKPPPNRFPWYIFLVGLIGISIVFMAKRPFVVYDDNGQPQLSEWRKEKLEKELKNLEHAEQYVLLATMSGTYPCFSCIDKATIRLRKNQIWKYGITTKGKEGRYEENWLRTMNLKYVIQFEGTITECLREERIKIYNYAIHPENIIRKKPLIRPPGNKNDS